jgi:toxin-antitoxin system PIN domain toxin
MIIVDANVLLYAYDLEALQHESCRRWLTAALNGSELIGLPWQSALAFIRISTHAKIYVRPMTMDVATGLISSWLERPQVVSLLPESRYWSILRDQLKHAQVRGPMVMDAALAALAIEHGAALCSTDRDFRRFDGLRLVDPTRDA